MHCSDLHYNALHCPALYLTALQCSGQKNTSNQCEFIEKHLFCIDIIIVKEIFKREKGFALLLLYFIVQSSESTRNSSESPQKIPRKSSESPQKVLRHQSSIISHLIDCPSLEQGWMRQTSLISNLDTSSDRHTDIQTEFCWPALIQRPPFRDGLTNG